MGRRARYLAVGFLVSSFLLLLITQAAYAHHGGVSQFLLFKSARTDGPKLFNPTSREQFALGIYYDDDENFDTCEGVVLTPHDREDLSASNNRGSLEVISVATTGDIAGKKAGGHKVGLQGWTHKHFQAWLIDHALFSPPKPADVQNCACNEVDNFGLPKDILKAFLGFICP